MSERCRCECNEVDWASLSTEEIVEAIRVKCDHQWNGPWEYWDLPRGGREGTVTCSVCGMTAAEHDDKCGLS